MGKEVNAPASNGRRERKKEKTVRLIRETAFEIFSRDGFENAKIKDIADAADIAERTLFNYVANKRDLLAFVMSDSITQLCQESFPEGRWDAPLLEQLLEEFERQLAYYGEYFPVSLMLFQEVIAFNPAREVKRIVVSREIFYKRLVALIEHMQERGVLATEHSMHDATAVVFSVFMGGVRRWLISESRDEKEASERLRRQFQIVIKGLSPE